MNIKLTEMSLKNFKGIKDLNIDFSKITNIYGENATGKTTVFDAFCWLLFGKDSKSRSSFEVQPLDESNNVKHGLDTVVSATIDIDGITKEFIRTLSEKWVKQRGQAEAELKGTTTTYEINNVPVKQKEYLAEISSIINEDLFKMVTNPLYFPSLKWQDQRKILLEIIGDIEVKNVLAYNTSLSPLGDKLGEGVENYNKSLKNSISKLNEQIKAIPYRIDECNNSIVEVNTNELMITKKDREIAIKGIDDKLTDVSKANEGKLKLQDKLFALKNKERELQAKAIAEADKPRQEVLQRILSVENGIRLLVDNEKASETHIQRFIDDIERVDLLIKAKSESQDGLRNKFNEVAAREFEFDEKETICPHCGRAYEEDKIAEIKDKAKKIFESNKKDEIDRINNQGKELGKKINNYKADKERLVSDKDRLEKEKAEIQKKIEDNKAILYDLEKQKEQFDNATEIKIDGLEEVQKEIQEVETQIDNFNVSDNTELKLQKSALQKELEGINSKLGATENNEKLKKRIEELIQGEKDLNVKKAELEGQQFLCEEYIRTKVELLEDSINKKFNGAVAFKLFNQQVNGGLSECCEALVNGVPFGNVNTAGQINAGLSIIKTLCEHYNVQAPIFIDNRESVNNLIDLDNQIINLVVSEDKELRILEVEE